MAENKKSFVLYCDLIHTIKKMPAEKAGELFLHILKYVNDENPTTEDLIIDLTFEPIKQSLKRDLCKWNIFIERQSKNGKLGGRPKKEETQITQPFLNKPKKAVSVSVSDNVSDIKIKKEKVFIPPTKIEFMLFAKSKLQDDLYQKSKQKLEWKWEAWNGDEWKDGNGKKISNWNTKLFNSLKYITE